MIERGQVDGHPLGDEVAEEAEDRRVVVLTGEAGRAGEVGPIAEGLAELADIARGEEEYWQNEVAGWVEAGPDLGTDGVVRWRRSDLANRIEERFGVTLNVRTVGKVLRKLGFSRMSPRPQHPQSDEAAQEEYKKSSPSRSPHSPTSAKARPVPNRTLLR